MVNIGLAISGGATKIAFFIGAVLGLFKKIPKSQFKYLIGTSSGALVVFCIALNRLDILKKYAYNYTLKTIFGQDVNKNVNQIIGFVRLLSKGYMFEYKGLERILNEEINQNEFDHYLYDKYSPTCYIHTFDLETNENVYHNLHSLTLDEAKKAVLASCSIPFWVKAQKVKDKKEFDGGIGKHNASEWLIQTHHKDIDIMYSIYSRTKDIGLYKWNFTYKLLRLLDRVFQVFSLHQSKRDEIDTDEICNKNAIEHLKIFPSFVLTNSTFETSIDNNKEMFEEGLKSVKLVLRKKT